MPVIAIDGPVGAGKSTVARALAERLGLEHLDTGSMYRSVTLGALRRSIDPTAASPETLVEIAQTTEIDTSDPELRSHRVGRAVSTVAAVPGVRAVLVARQRDWIEDRKGGVVDGRDIGSVVLPDADLKVFLTASAEERARRREADETAADLARRDELDSSRAASPLVVADGAILIDTTGRSVDDIVDEIVKML